MNGPTLVHYLFLLVALVCFFLAFVRWKEPPAIISIGWLGLFFWMLDVLVFSTGTK
jgi:hypothetical protein